MNGAPINPAAVPAAAIYAFGEPNRRLSTRRELRFGRNGSVAVILDRGVWYDHESGQGGGLRALGLPVLGAASESPAERREREARQEAEARRRRALAARLWRSGEPLKGTAAETYLRRPRAIAAPLDQADLRFLANAPLRPLAPECAETAPAIAARISTAQCEGLGVHLTFLRPDGLGKAEVPEPRKIIGRAGGGMIRLAPGARLIVAEGIESAFSAMEALADPSAGCVAAISAGGMARMAWPAETVELILAPDQDASGTGERAALALAERGHAAGLSVGFLRPPPPHKDWNDAARVRETRP